jgi:hypothetical protein
MLCARPTVLARDTADDDGGGVVVLEAAQCLYPQMGVLRDERGALPSGKIC